MAPDLQQKHRLVLEFSQAVQSFADPKAVFKRAAEVLHELTGCVRARLIFSTNRSLGCPGFSAEFTGSLRCVDLGAPCRLEPVVQWVFAERKARIGPSSAADKTAGELDPDGVVGQASLFLPVPCREELIGVLELTRPSDSWPESWDQTVLGNLAGLLGVTLDGLAARARVAELQRFQGEASYLRGQIKTERDLRLLTGESPAMKAVRLAIQQVAPADTTVLILGETGTGKELVARAIHQLSPRRDHLLVTVNCAALAAGILASELFGHEQGAFTGAIKRRIGRFELAQRGTLFLDEIGELSADTQVMLLRALQERVIERVGGQVPIPVDVRVVAATHQDLASATGQGGFRADLFFRLNVFPIHLPPLRDRREDIPDLARYFLNHFSRRMNKPVTRIGTDTMELLMKYPWPGNIRELENIMERAMIVTVGETLELDPSWLRQARPVQPLLDQEASLAERERQSILGALQRCHGKIYGPGGAAALLGVKPTTLYGKMRKHGIAKRPPEQA